MKKEDFQKWLNEGFSESDSEILDKTIMNNLLEHRLQMQFKQRLQDRRRRRMYIKWGLILTVILGVLSLLMLKMCTSPKADLSTISTQNTPANTEIATTQTIDKNSISMPNSVKKEVSTPILNTQPIIENSFKNEENIPVLTTQKLQEVSKQASKPPTDTQYIYLQSQKEPLNYPRQGTDEPKAAAVTTLNLSDQKLKAIPPSVFTNKELEILQLNNNQITQLSDSIGVLTQLKTLNLRNNRLKTLPDELRFLKELTDLNLRNNRLSTLPFNLEDLKKLKNLSVRENYIEEYPLCFERMAGLISLDLRYNKLSEIPPSIANLKNLEWLDLGYNRLSSLPEEVFQLKNLKLLDLSGNNFSRSDIRELEKELPDCKIIFY